MSNKKEILKFLKVNKTSAFAATSLMDKLSIAKTTFYRNIKSLINENAINALFDDKLKENVYQYNDSNNPCSSHIHLICEKCGCIIHLNCDFIASHIKDEHNFIIDKKNTRITGICDKCMEDSNNA